MKWQDIGKRNRSPSYKHYSHEYNTTLPNSACECHNCSSINHGARGGGSPCFTTSSKSYLTAADSTEAKLDI